MSIPILVEKKQLLNNAMLKVNILIQTELILAIREGKFIDMGLCSVIICV
jgi:hypothetical protein